jgi:PAS domain S-box-containing protein
MSHYQTASAGSPVHRKRRLIRPAPDQYFVLLLCCVLILFIAPVISAADEAKDEPVVFVGVQSLPPLSYLQHNKPAGLLVDLAFGLAERMNRPAQVLLKDRSNAYELLENGQADALLLTNVNENYSNMLDISSSVLISEFSIFSTSEYPDINNIDDLRGLRVGVEEIGVPILLIQEYPEISAKIIPAPGDAFEMLTSGEVDVVLVDRWAVSHMLPKHNIRAVKLFEKVIKTAHSAIAVKKGNKALLSKINMVLADIREDGTYDAIVNHWRFEETTSKVHQQMRQQAWLIIIIVTAPFVILCWLFVLEREIWRRRQAEAGLKQSQRLLARSQEIAHVGSWIHHLANRRLTCSDEIYRIYGLDPQEFAATYEAFLDIIHPEDRTAVDEGYYNSLREGKESYEIEHRIVRKHTGKIRFVHNKCIHERDKDGMIFRSVGIMQDITDRKLAEENEERLRFETLLSDLSARFISSNQVDSDIRDSLRRVCECLSLELSTLWQWEPGHTASLQLTHSHLPSDFPLLPEQMDVPEYFPWSICDMHNVEEPDKTFALLPLYDASDDRVSDAKMWHHYIFNTELIFPLLTKDGQAFGALFFNNMEASRIWLQPLFKRLELIAQVFADALVRRRTDQALRESEERLAIATEAAASSSWILDVKSGRLWFGPGNIGLFGLKSTDPMTIDSYINMIHPDDRTAVREGIDQALNSGEMKIFEYRIIRPDGSIHWLQSRGRLSKSNQKDIMWLTGIISDITERKLAEIQEKEHQENLAQAAKMASLGTLVAGVAHEINNPNNFIMLNAPLLEQVWDDALPVLDIYYANHPDFELGDMPFAKMRDNTGKLFSGIHKGSRRIKRIVSELKNFSRQTPLDMSKNVNLNQVVERSLTMLEKTISQHTDDFAMNLDPNLPMIRGDFQKLEQVFVNLLINACQALPDKNCKIIVETLSDPDDQTVILRITDEGEGISPENIVRICDPFFSTRYNIGGTGLGLAVSSSIIRMHEARMVFNSKPGRGTIVSIFFKLIEQ